MAEAPLVDVLGAVLQLLERREMAAVDYSVAPCVPACISLDRAARAQVVAFSLASLTRRAICSLLSIIVRVKVKPLASIDFTA